jgi:hypothetical protein
VFTEVNIDEVSILEESKWVCHHELLLETWKWPEKNCILRPQFRDAIITAVTHINS